MNIAEIPVWVLLMFVVYGWLCIAEPKLLGFSIASWALALLILRGLILFGWLT